MNTKPLMFAGVAGAAFKLRSPHNEDVELNHPQGKVYLREGSYYIETQLTTAPHSSSLRDDAWNVIQEVLDVYSVKNRRHIGTKRGEYDYVRWLQGIDGYEVWFTETMEFKWNMKMECEVTNPNGTKPDSPPPPSFFHHPSFRFYRLSQLTDDLFDSYRNAYLALECIVSDESPKGSENEQNWLKRVLGGSLKAGMPGGTEIDSTVDELYANIRTHLFHAKSVNRFFLPYSMADRERVQKSLRQLIFILSTLINFKFGTQFPAGWAQKSTGLIDLQARVTFKLNEVICRNKEDQQLLIPVVEVVDNPRRFNNLWANLSFNGSLNIPSVTGFTLRNDGEDMIYLDLEEPWLTKDVIKINLELNHLDSSVSAPNPAHPI